MARETDLVCAQCNQKVSVLGSTNMHTGEVYCDNCAIYNYRVTEGFRTRKAAEAHRRRMFDTTYLLTEVLFDKYLAFHRLANDDLLSDTEKQTLLEISYKLDNLVPKPKKIELQNTLDQAKIERYYNRFIDQWLTIPQERIE